MKKENDCDEFEGLSDFWKNVDSFDDRFPEKSIITNYRELVGCLESLQIKQKMVYINRKHPHPYIVVDKRPQSYTLNNINEFTIGKHYFIYVDYSIILEWIDVLFFFDENKNYQYINKTKCIKCEFDNCSILNQFNKYRDKNVKYLKCCLHTTNSQGVCYNCKERMKDEL